MSVYVDTMLALLESWDEIGLVLVEKLMLAEPDFQRSSYEVLSNYKTDEVDLRSSLSIASNIFNR